MLLRGCKNRMRAIVCLYQSKHNWSPWQACVFVLLFQGLGELLSDQRIWDFESRALSKSLFFSPLSPYQKHCGLEAAIKFGSFCFQFRLHRAPDCLLVCFHEGCKDRLGFAKI